MRKLIVYVDRDSGEKGRFFLKIIQKRMPGIKMHICRTVDTCVTEVNQTKSYMESPIIVLFTDNEDRLDDLYDKKQIYQDKKIVMVLPREKKRDNTAVIHRFFPRYFTYMDDQYDDLCDVLHKMIVQ
ncbi:MAG: hypothetical protein V2J08_04980 [Desulfotignum sp.]|jgi:hypothetical protein|nr:hypothetical protein [Desulfotignum sp.]